MLWHPVGEIAFCKMIQGLAYRAKAFICHITNLVHALAEVGKNACLVISLKTAREIAHGTSSDDFGNFCRGRALAALHSLGFGFFGRRERGLHIAGEVGSDGGINFGNFLLEGADGIDGREVALAEAGLEFGNGKGGEIAHVIR